MRETTEQFWTKKTVIGSENMEAWRLARDRIGARYQQKEEGPNSAASLDRKRSRGKSKDQRENRRSGSADHSRHRRTEHNVRGVNLVNNVRNVMLSDDSGNSSLNTYTSDNSDVKEGRWE